MCGEASPWEVKVDQEFKVIFSYIGRGPRLLEIFSKNNKKLNKKSRPPLSFSEKGRRGRPKGRSRVSDTLLGCHF